jgi:hypothetical protein
MGSTRIVFRRTTCRDRKKGREGEAVKINVVDSIMGAGKTSWAIQYMKESPGPFLYVTPIKTEIERIMKACPEQAFIQPEIEERVDFKDMKVSRNKTNGLKSLLIEGENIATTHALFRLFDEETIELVRMHGYTLILDEVMDILDPVGKKGDTPQRLIEHGIVVAEGNPRVPGCVKLLPGPKDLAEYDYIKAYARQGRLVGVFNSMLLWLFPVDAFTAFKEIWNLCYLFDGQHQSAYFEIFKDEYDLECQKLSVVSRDGRYELTKHDPELDRPFIERARELIRLHEGPQNTVGDKQSGRHRQTLSVRWWTDKENAEKWKAVMAATRNWFRSLKAPAGSILWTALKKPVEKGIVPKDFASSYIPLNTRATNLYRERNVVAYLINKFFDPNIGLFFEATGVFHGEATKKNMESLL